MTKYRRKTANAKERERMKMVNQAFDRLREVMPDLNLILDQEKETKVFRDQKAGVLIAESRNFSIVSTESKKSTFRSLAMRPDKTKVHGNAIPRLKQQPLSSCCSLVRLHQRLQQCLIGNYIDFVVNGT
jgi:hypothetical protein